MTLKKHISKSIIASIILLSIFSVKLIGTSNTYLIVSLLIMFGYFFYTYTCYCGYSRFKVDLLDLSLLVFILYNFVSFIWTINGSLALDSSFQWLLVILWMLLVSLFKQSNNNQKTYLYFLIGSLIFLLISSFYAIVLGIEPNKEWNQVFGYNVNYFSLYISMLTPFILFCNHKFIYLPLTLIKLILCLSAISLTIYLSSRGATLCLIFLFLFYFVFKYNFIIIFKKLIIFSLIAIFLFFIFIYNCESLDNFLWTFLGMQDMERFYLLRNTFNIWTEAPFIGIGSGNWSIHAFKYFTHHNIRFGHPYLIFEYYSHNIYGKLLSELGTLGTIFIIYPVSIILLSCLKKINKLSPFEIASMTSLVIYLFSLNFYADTICRNNFFCGLQFLAFFNIATLKQTVTPALNLKMIYLMILLFLSGLNLYWFLDYRKDVYEYIEAQKLISNEQFDSGVNLIKSIYNPYARTKCGDKKLSFELAKLNQDKGDWDLASIWFARAISEFPFDREILYKYSFFLYKKNDILKARLNAEKFYEIQNNYIYNNFLLSSIHLDLDMPLVSLKYLKSVTYHTYYIDRVIEGHIKRIKEEYLVKNNVDTELITKEITQIEKGLIYEH